MEKFFPLMIDIKVFQYGKGEEQDIPSSNPYTFPVSAVTYFRIYKSQEFQLVLFFSCSLLL